MVFGALDVPRFTLENSSVFSVLRCNTVEIFRFLPLLAELIKIVKVGVEVVTADFHPF